MNGWTLTETTPANVLKLSACAAMDGRIYRCIRRAATITLADVETGAVRDVAGVEVVTRAVPASVPGALLGHVPGMPITAETVPAGVLVLIRTGWRWELARAEPTPFAFKGRQMRNFRAVTPWQRSPTRFRVPIESPCWLAVPVVDVALKHARTRPVAKPRSSRARPVSEHAPRKPPSPASQVTWGKGKKQPAAAELTHATCHVPGCDRPPFQAGYICPTHWQRLPSRIRQKLCVLWRGGLGRGPEYAAVFAEGLRLLVAKEAREGVKEPAAPVEVQPVKPRREPPAPAAYIPTEPPFPAGRPDLPWVRRPASIALSTSVEMREWWYVERSMRDGEERLVFETEGAAKEWKRQAGNVRPVKAIRATTLETEPAGDGLVRMRRPEYRGPKQRRRPPVRERKPYKDDDDKEED